MTSDTTENTGDGPDSPNSPPIRFIISHRMAPYRAGRARRSAKSNFSERLSRALGGSMDIVSDNGMEREDVRRVLVVEADEEELQAKMRDLAPDTIVERESLRWPASLRLAPWGSPEAPPPLSEQMPSNSNASAATPVFTFRVTSAGSPVADANVELSLLAVQLGAQPNSSSVSASTDAQGLATLPFDATQWQPVTAQVSPRGRVWSAMVVQPVSGGMVDLARLPTSGPLGWWHRLAGINTFDPQAGAGIRVGVIDSGLGPHPYLDHIVPAGAFIDGAFQPGPEATADVLGHGSHVSGLIGARPPAGGADFAGLAPGADVFTARVFAPNKGANQGDIAAAIDAMVNAHEVDIINLSLGGQPSIIEYDAVLAAYGSGTLCICAAGNDFGQAVLAPASYPLSVAVSAVGMPGTFPASNLANFTRPSQLDRYGKGGLFLPSYANIGRQVTVTAAGSAVISTIPADESEPAPYADMSGTSMATPVTTGALAVLLSRDVIYKNLARTSARTKYARAILENAALSIDLAQQYQGDGLSRAQ
ncbi:S8 family serine peptidase [Rhizobium skierniewicense]|uniref:S8 family serine peptidase n=1 Tax=Rhizobium skierniewicense TaxID=984260 RepID=UPI001FAC7F9B|nr:S8 family serine peptidase [Rhizobium skierniewicense]MCI9865754.1 S8 family serine peptidase [Rhizobium skierniewicense]